MSRSTIDIVNRNLAKRYAKVKRFRLFGLASILAGLTALCFLLPGACFGGYSRGGLQEGLGRTTIGLIVVFCPSRHPVDTPGPQDEVHTTMKASSLYVSGSRPYNDEAFKIGSGPV